MTIQNVTPEKLAAVKAKLISEHMAEITGDDTSGSISGHGATANYAYNAEKQELTVNVIHHAFFIPVVAIEAQMRKAFD